MYSQAGQEIVISVVGDHPAHAGRHTAIARGLSFARSARVGMAKENRQSAPSRDPRLYAQRRLTRTTSASKLWKSTRRGRIRRLVPVPRIARSLAYLAEWLLILEASMSFEISKRLSNLICASPLRGVAADRDVRLLGVEILKTFIFIQLKLDSPSIKSE